MKVRGDFLGPPRSTDKTTLIIKVSKGAKIRNRYNLMGILNLIRKIYFNQKKPLTKKKKISLYTFS